MTSMPAINPESYLEGEQIRTDVVEPQELSPVDSYWWSMEQADGEIETAVDSIGSTEEAIRFTLGLHQDLFERSKNGTQTKVPGMVRKKISGALADDDTSKTDPLSELEKARSWEIAMTLSSLGVTMEKASSMVGQISETRRHVEGLFELALEDTKDRLMIDEDNIEELELISQGQNSAERGIELGISSKEASYLRTVAAKRMRADSMPHSIRLAIEHGLIPLEEPTPSEPGISLNAKDTKILELFSRGMYETAIAKQIGVKPPAVGVRLHQMIDKFSANSRNHMIRRAFEEGVLTPDPQANVHLSDAACLLGQLERHLKGVTGQFRQFIISEVGEDIFKLAQDEPLPIIRPVTGFTNGLRQRINNLSDVSDSINSIINGAFSGLGRIYSAGSDELSPLSSKEQAEIELSSQGHSIHERTDSSPEKAASSHIRSTTFNKLGALNINHAIRRAIELGTLPLSLSRPRRKITLGGQQTVDILDRISRGQGNTEIAGDLGFKSKFKVGRALSEAKSALSSSNTAQAVFRSFEERILLPDSKDTRFFEMLTELEDAGLAASNILARAKEALFKVNPFLFNRILLGMTQLEFIELQAAADGATVTGRAVEEKISRKSMDSRRHNLIIRLGANTTSHAVKLAIEKGLLEINTENGKAKPQLSDVQSEIFLAIANGALATSVAEERKVSETTVYTRLKEIRELLSAETTPEAVKNAFIKGLLEIPDDGPLVAPKASKGQSK